MMYQVFQLKDEVRPGTLNLIQHIEAELEPALGQQAATVFGIFTALLGLPSNELYLVTCAARPITLPKLKDVTLVSTVSLQPTLRPLAHQPRNKPGVYVFRWFSVEPESVDDIVSLSGAAWPSFEADFAAEIQGLFVEDSEAPSQMLLITWYQDLQAWQASRQPSPDARENFLKRHKLTKRALPIATELRLQGTPSALVSST